MLFSYCNFFWFLYVLFVMVVVLLEWRDGLDQGCRSIGHQGGGYARPGGGCREKGDEDEQERRRKFKEIMERTGLQDRGDVCNGKVLDSRDQNRLSIRLSAVESEVDDDASEEESLVPVLVGSWDRGNIVLLPSEVVNVSYSFMFVVCVGFQFI